MYYILIHNMLYHTRIKSLLFSYFLILLKKFFFFFKFCFTKTHIKIVLMACPICNKKIKSKIYLSIYVHDRLLVKLCNKLCVSTLIFNQIEIKKLKLKLKLKKKIKYKNL